MNFADLFVWASLYAFAGAVAGRTRYAVACYRMGRYKWDTDTEALCIFFGLFWPIAIPVSLVIKPFYFYVICPLLVKAGAVIDLLCEKLTNQRQDQIIAYIAAQRADEARKPKRRSSPL